VGVTHATQLTCRHRRTAVAATRADDFPDPCSLLSYTLIRNDLFLKPSLVYYS